MMEVRAPQLTDVERDCLQVFYETYALHEEAVRTALHGRIAATQGLQGAVEMLGPAKSAEVEASRQRTREALLEDRWQPYLKALVEQGSHFARLGIDFATWFEMSRVFQDVLMPRLLERHRADSDKLVSALRGMNVYLDIAMSTLGAAYLQTKEAIIGAQRASIRELSTPVLQVRPRLLIVPLIGVVDTHRARHLTESLLRAIRARRARVVVMDITGVPIVDSKVAGHLMQTVDAARLMGATVFVTGISPEIAQTLVTLGVELRDIHTAGDLEEGLSEAEQLLAQREQAEASSGRPS